MSRATVRLQAIALAGVIGFTAPASIAFAQASQPAKGDSHAAAAKPGHVSGVVVQAPPKSTKIPPAKRAGFDAEAAKRKSWDKYRKTTPTAKAAASATPGASAKAENYPGVRSVASH